MSRKKVEEWIRKKEQEIQGLEAQIREARAYLKGLQDVLRMMPRDDSVDDGEVVIRPGSSVDEARQIILKNGAPMHVMDILKAMGKEPSRESRSSLSSSLAAYVRRNEVFTRPRPNTFGLIELGQGGVATNEAAPALPLNFGRVPKQRDLTDEEL